MYGAYFPVVNFLTGRLHMGVSLEKFLQCGDLPLFSSLSLFLCLSHTLSYHIARGASHTQAHTPTTQTLALTGTLDCEHNSTHCHTLWLRGHVSVVYRFVLVVGGLLCCSFARMLSSLVCALLSFVCLVLCCSLSSLVVYLILFLSLGCVVVVTIDTLTYRIILSCLVLLALDLFIIPCSRIHSERIDLVS
jgi:hypothetical protein